MQQIKKTIMTKEEKPSVDTIINLIKSLNLEQQKDFDKFMDGFNLAVQIFKGKEPVKN